MTQLLSVAILVIFAGSGYPKAQADYWTLARNGQAKTQAVRPSATAWLDRMLKVWDCHTYELKKMASDQMLSIEEMQTISDATPWLSETATAKSGYSPSNRLGLRRSSKFVNQFT